MSPDIETDGLDCFVPLPTVAKQLVPEPLLIPWTDIPRALSMSRAHLARMRVAGKFGPTVLRSGRKLLVRRDELESWINADMPDARTWAAIQATGRRRVMG